MKLDLSPAMFKKVQSCSSAARTLLEKLWRYGGGPATYQPAAHYMRGPGPACRIKAQGLDRNRRLPPSQPSR